jgi:hypothetical protein
MLIHFVYLWTRFSNWSQKLIKAWVKPTPPSLIIGVLSDLTHSRADLVVENALFRQQQPLRETTSWVKGPKFLIHDRDSKYGSHFSAVAAGAGIKELRTSYRAPRAKGICERFMGSLRRECLDHTLVLHGKHLQRVIKEYTAYFNQERPHQGIGQHIPDHFDLPKSNPTERIASKAFLGGLHHSYSRVTHLN